MVAPCRQVRRRDSVDYPPSGSRNRKKAGLVVEAVFEERFLILTDPIAQTRWIGERSRTLAAQHEALVGKNGSALSR